MNKDQKIPDAIKNIDMRSMIEEWNTSRVNRETYTNDFPSLDNLVDGVPLYHQKDAPYVGDTTIAGLVRSIPRNSLQQLPIFGVSINGTKNSTQAALSSFFVRHNVLNEDTFGKGLLSTLQMGTEQAITHGYSTFMTIASEVLDDFGTTMRLMHYTDVDPEPGIQDFNESGFFYVVANLTKSRVRKIRDAAKQNPNTSWNIPALDELLEMTPETKNYSIYQSDPQKKAQQEYIANTYQFVTRYDVGRDGQFCTFCPQLAETALRCIKNKSKFGYPRVQGLVIDPAPLTPFGLSRVRLASPNQNLANIYYQSIASMLLLNAKPPILKRGRFTKSVQLTQGAVWEALDQNATAELKSMDNGALSQFTPMMKFLASQIQNIMGSPFSAVNNGGEFSKTGPGVKQQNDVQDLTTNQITNILENFLRQYVLVALDTFISEQTTERTVDPKTGEKIANDSVVIVDDECKNAINRIAEQQFKPTEEQPEFIAPIGDDNKITVDWNDLYDFIETWTIEIELSLGKQEMEEKQRADLQDTLVTLLQNDDGSDPELRQRAKMIMDMILEKSVPQAKRMSIAPPVALPTGNPQMGAAESLSPSPSTGQQLTQ